jgi:hypothetical protein
MASPSFCTMAWTSAQLMLVMSYRDMANALDAASESTLANNILLMPTTASLQQHFDLPSNHEC